jgi:hypothetical protein
MWPTSSVWSDRRRKHFLIDTGDSEGGRLKGEIHADIPGIDGTALEKAIEEL